MMHERRKLLRWQINKRALLKLRQAVNEPLGLITRKGSGQDETSACLAELGLAPLPYLKLFLLLRIVENNDGRYNECHTEAAKRILRAYAEKKGVVLEEISLSEFAKMLSKMEEETIKSWANEIHYELFGSEIG